MDSIEIAGLFYLLNTKFIARDATDKLEVEILVIEVEIIAVRSRVFYGMGIFDEITN